MRKDFLIFGAPSIEREEIPCATGMTKVTTIRDRVIQEEERIFRLLKTNERITIE